jgi:hypothetical protein
MSAAQLYAIITVNESTEQSLNAALVNLLDSMKSGVSFEMVY